MNKSKIELVFFDLNDTLVKESSWYKLNLAMGMTPEENAKFYKLYQSGKITYKQWIEAALKIYRERGNLKREEIERVVANSYKYFEHARRLVAYSKEKYLTAIGSCSMGLLAERISRELGIEHHRSLTDFFFTKNGFIDQIKVNDHTGNDAQNKVHFLREICTELGVKLENCACIGDGRNDLELFRATGNGIAFERSSDQAKSLARWVATNIDSPSSFAFMANLMLCWRKKNNKKTYVN